jgi:hypothetical protein
VGRHRQNARTSAFENPADDDSGLPLYDEAPSSLLWIGVVVQTQHDGYNRTSLARPTPDLQGASND